MTGQCHICNEPTNLCCSDCAITLGAHVYVCNKQLCSDEHEHCCPQKLLTAMREARRLIGFMTNAKIAEASRVLMEAYGERWGNVKGTGS